MKFDLTHTSGVVYLLASAARELLKEHAHRPSRVTAAVSTCYYLVAQTVSLIFLVCEEQSARLITCFSKKSMNVLIAEGFYGI